MSSRKTARQTEDESPNLRPYQAPRMDSTDASQVPGAEGYAEFEAMAEEKQYAEVPPPSAGANVGPTTPAPPAGPSPPVRPGSAPAATSLGQGAYVPPPAAPPATDPAQMLASLVNMFSLQQQAIATSHQQMHAFMVQQARFQQEMYEMQARANRQKQKANPPKFHGRAEDDLELWLFHIEEHFAAYTVEMSSNDSRFVDMVVPFLGVDVMAWYREFKHAMGSSPRTWPLFKQQIRSRYRDNDYEFKILTKMHDLRVTTTQQEYSTKFTQLLSMSDISMPEIVKRWFYQQNLRADTNSYVSQNCPRTLKDTIDHAQGFEDSRETPKPKSASTTMALKQNRFQQGKPKGNEAGGSNTQPPVKSIPNSGAVPRQATGDQPSVDYENADALLMLQNSSPHGHLQQSGLVENQPMSAFIDSGASFNTVCPQFAARVGLKGGTTRLVRPRDLPKLLRAADNEFCFLINHSDASGMSEKAAAAWTALEGTAVYPLLLEFRDVVFRSELPSVPPTRQNMDASIEVSDSTPVHRKQFPFSKEQREAILQWTREMLKAKLIRPSSSPYCAPTFCVRKANGEWRIVHDFRGLNAKVRVPANPIPRKDEILRAMARGKLFSALDLLWGFFQVKLREDSIPYTAFSTPDGLYEYLVTPMGISSSPSCFNRLVQSIFKDCNDFCQTYFDDLFVFTPSDPLDDHLAALRKVLTRCAEQQLYVKIEKCVFCAHEIPCLGDIVGADGVRIDPTKASAIRDWPLPRTKREMQSFIGTCVYVSRFCAGFAEHVALLTEVVKNKRPRDSISLSEEQLLAFRVLKDKLSTPPTLAHADFTRSVHVSVDASDFSIGGYLFQHDDAGRERIIAYGERKLTQAELIYPTREKELLAALHAMRSWEVYLIDKPFYLNTDHRTIESILQQQTCSQRLARWLNKLSLYQPRFKWVAGSTNIVADSVSRRPDWSDGSSRAISLSELLHQLTAQIPDTEPSSLFAQSTPAELDILDACRKNYSQDQIFGPIMLDLVGDQDNGSRRLRRFHMHDGLLYFQVRPDTPRRLCIPDVPELRNAILFEEHDTPARGHPGQAKTLLLLLEKYYWRDRRWADISMDFMTQLTLTASGHDAVMVIVDRLTKRGHFVATRTDATAADTARLFCDFFQRLHGLTETIVSDRDTKFTSKLWQQIMKLQGTRLRLSTAFRPSTDGQSEVTIKFVNEYLRHFISPHHDDWDSLLPLAEFAYNARVHSTTGMSPFVADLGYQPRSVADCVVPSSRQSRAS
ncbi:unnamed protein product [Phytophthora fragariaefolia]|uniref:Unnamed protein product n=1 Tax=Phytophthora fragariaefolia TaxID=1490495 RepID=A0A9W7CZP8_9STRA|nr:unnamed protein product [Phytophthora fragariaefolia]